VETSPIVSAPPSKANGSNGCSRCRAPSTVNTMSVPSTSMMIRSMPENDEKAPDADTSAMLMRQSNSS
jgi:hypothetical protein